MNGLGPAQSAHIPIIAKYFICTQKWVDRFGWKQSALQPFVEEPFENRIPPIGSKPEGMPFRIVL
jgi:hypothetical protein